VAALRWKQLFEKARETSINFKVLYDALRNLESTWERDILSKGEVIRPRYIKITSFLN
jgi:hypothetical protein